MHEWQTQREDATTHIHLLRCEERLPAGADLCLPRLSPLPCNPLPLGALNPSFMMDVLPTVLTAPRGLVLRSWCR
jgi:hypothetical protein